MSAEPKPWSIEQMCYSLGLRVSSVVDCGAVLWRWAKGGRPPYDPVMMLKVLILAAQNTVRDARMEYLIRDRLSLLRFLGFDLGAATPDANTIWLFREKLTEGKRRLQTSVSYTSVALFAPLKPIKRFSTS